MTTHSRYNSNKFSKYFKLLVGLAVITFGATLYILSSNLEYLSDVVSFDLDSKQFKSPLKTVELVNHFDHEISIHYDEGTRHCLCLYLLIHSMTHATVYLYNLYRAISASFCNLFYHDQTVHLTTLCWLIDFLQS